MDMENQKAFSCIQQQVEECFLTLETSEFLTWDIPTRTPEEKLSLLFCQSQLALMGTRLEWGEKIQLATEKVEATTRFQRLLKSAIKLLVLCGREFASKWWGDLISLTENDDVPFQIKSYLRYIVKIAEGSARDQKLVELDEMCVLHFYERMSIYWFSLHVVSTRPNIKLISPKVSNITVRMAKSKYIADSMYAVNASLPKLKIGRRYKDDFMDFTWEKLASIDDTLLGEDLLYYKVGFLRPEHDSKALNLIYKLLQKLEQSKTSLRPFQVSMLITYAYELTDVIAIEIRQRINKVLARDLRKADIASHKVNKLRQINDFRYIDMDCLKAMHENAEFIKSFMKDEYFGMMPPNEGLAIAKTVKDLNASSIFYSDEDAEFIRKRPQLLHFPLGVRSQPNPCN